MDNCKQDILRDQSAILYIKRNFEDRLANALNLQRVSSPLFINSLSGVQDNLNGIEQPICFSAKEIDNSKFEIVQSLAKWKRQALAKYCLGIEEGIYTDMNALRPDENDLTTGIHSIYVDQWDWEKVISKEDRTLKYLKSTVKTIYNVILDIEKLIANEFNIAKVLSNNIEFIHTEDLLSQYPNMNMREREDSITKKYGSVFLIGIGGELANGQPHDGRAPDYDDWTTSTGNGRNGLNGDILVWNDTLERSFELSSMGIRVDKNILHKQLVIRGCEERENLLWHKELLSGKFPQSIGGGIGQSRLCMLLLKKLHIGEVQASAWPDSVYEECKTKGIYLL